MRFDGSTFVRTRYTHLPTDPSMDRSGSLSSVSRTSVTSVSVGLPPDEEGLRFLLHRFFSADVHEKCNDMRSCP